MQSNADESSPVVKPVLKAVKKIVVKNNPSVIREQKVLAARAFQIEMGLEGIFAIYKPTNWSSFDMVLKARNTLQRVFQEKHPKIKLKFGQLKVGHGGTLDPLAMGVMVVGVGRATKLMDAYTAGSKEYETILQLGYETTTGDTEGEQVGQVHGWKHVTEEMISNACNDLTGDIMQVPPIYSALNIDGKRAYELAREGVEVELAARPVTVFSIELLKEYKETAPDIHLRITCGGGTYIRSMARDLGRALSSAAHMTHLVRTKHGEFGLDACVSHEDINNADAILSAMKANAETFLDRLSSDDDQGVKKLASKFAGGTQPVKHTCEKCNKELPSKNALFRHLRSDNNTPCSKAHAYDKLKSEE